MQFERFCTHYSTNDARAPCGSLAIWAYVNMDAPHPLRTVSFRCGLHLVDNTFFRKLSMEEWLILEVHES